MAEVSETQCFTYGGQGNEVTWEVAENTCVDIGGHLASIQDINQQRAVIGLMQVSLKIIRWLVLSKFVNKIPCR